MAIKRLQHLRGAKDKLTETPLKDAELYLDTDNHEVVVGDTSLADKNFTLANKSDVTSLADEVDTLGQEVADVQTDYAKTTGGNTLTANSVVVANADGKLTGLTGTEGQLIKIGADGVPEVSDAEYLPLSGGTMTGSIYFGGNAASINPVGTDSGVEMGFASGDTDCFARVGGGTVNLQAKVTPGTTTYQSYVNLSVNDGITISAPNTVNKKGVTITNVVTPTTDDMAANKAYVDSAIAAIPTSKPYNHAVAATLPVSSTSPTSVDIAGLPANCDAFLCMPTFTEWTNQPRSWCRLNAVVADATAGRILFHHQNAIPTAVPFVVYWTE